MVQESKIERLAKELKERRAAEARTYKKLCALMREASEDGLSLSHLSRITGLGITQVRRIVKEAA